MILRWIFWKYDEVLTGLVWFRIGISEELLLSAVMNIVFHKMLGNYLAATQLMASLVVLGSIELLNEILVNRSVKM
jgi:hypothetical protein